MKYVLLLLSVAVCGQNVPNGAIYQAAAMNGIPYIAPDTGQQMLEQKAGLSPASIANAGLGNATLMAAILGITKEIAMSQPWVFGLVTAHSVWDAVGPHVLSIAVPNPAALISSLLKPEDELVIDTRCAKGTLLARTFKGSKPIGQVSVYGTEVTFSPQANAVMVNAVGSRIKGVTIWSVIVCPGNKLLSGGDSNTQLLHFTPLLPQDLPDGNVVIKDMSPAQRELAMRIYRVHQDALENLGQ